MAPNFSHHHLSTQQTIIFEFQWLCHDPHNKHQWFWMFWGKDNKSVRCIFHSCILKLKSQHRSMNALSSCQVFFLTANFCHLVSNSWYEKIDWTFNTSMKYLNQESWVPKFWNRRNAIIWKYFLSWYGASEYYLIAINSWLAFPIVWFIVKSIPHIDVSLVSLNLWIVCCKYFFETFSSDKWNEINTFG